MAAVTGNYVISSGQPLPSGAVPKIEAVPSKNAVTVDGRVISAEPQTVTPDSVTGAFTLDLIPTVDVLDRGFHYLIRGYYLNPDGYGSGGFTRVDLFEQTLHVPTGGGQLGELASLPGIPQEAWVFMDPTWSEADPDLGITATNLPNPILYGAVYVSADKTNPDLGTGQTWKAVA